MFNAFRHRCHEKRVQSYNNLTKQPSFFSTFYAKHYISVNYIDSHILLKKSNESKGLSKHQNPHRTPPIKRTKYLHNLESKRHL